MLQKRKGFTLIELLVVIGIVGILLSITIVAINPARQFKLANDATRSAGVNTISSAIAQMMVDGRGLLQVSLGTNIPNTLTGLSSGNATMVSLCRILTGTDSINTTLTAQAYIPKLPVDPGSGYSFTSCASFDTGYEISVNSTTGKMIINAPRAELTSISVTR